MNERLAQIRTALRLNTTAFAKELGLNQPTYSRYENGTNKLPPEMIKQLADSYNVNIHWLFTGVGEMFLPKPKTEQQIFVQERLAQLKTFGQRLNFLQGEMGIVDSKLSDLTGIKESKIAKFGLDKAEPAIEELILLCDVFEVSMDLLLRGKRVDAPAPTQKLTQDEVEALNALMKKLRG